MGGWGSGRDDYARTPTVEECRHLDTDRIKDLTKRPGTASVVRWGDPDDPTATIGAHAEGERHLEDETRTDRLRLVYTTTDPRTDETEERDYTVSLEYTPCNYGGHRPWFRCPAVVDGRPCRRRCRKLYLPPRGSVFACRECYDLGYTSSRTSGKEWKQAELRYRRAFAKADAENRRPHPNNDPYLPERPKGMHHDTFEELLADVEQAREEFYQAFHYDLATSGSSPGRLRGPERPGPWG